MLPAFFSFIGEGVKMPLSIGLATASIIVAITILSTIYEEEGKYKKAAALITTIGYSRDTQIKARFLLAYSIYFYCMLVFVLEYYFIPGIGQFNIQGIIISLFTFTVVASIYLFSTTTFGLQAGRLISILVILLISLGPTLMSRLHIKINIDILEYVGNRGFLTGILVVSLMLVALSLLLSEKSYRKKDL